MDFDFIWTYILMPLIGGGIASSFLGPYVTKFLEFLWGKIQRKKKTPSNLTKESSPK